MGLVAEDYVVVKGRSPEELEDRVNGHLAGKDYVVQGGIVVCGAMWVQALVLPDQGGEV